jgi:SPP1 family predicted phage head-tail adaptor
MLGQLNQRATILAQTLTPDGGGGYSESWNMVAILWARLTPVSGRDRTSADHLQSRARHKLTLRRNTIVNAGQRVQIGTREFAIHAVLDPGPQSGFIALALEELP